jgi:hypothetical protein
MTEPQKSYKDPSIKVLATSEERIELDELAGGTRQVSNYIRRLIREDAERRGKPLPENLFQPRPGGNSTKGEDRRGGKEYGRSELSSTPVFA